MAVGAAVLVFFITCAFVWRDDILRTWLDPKQPFQTYEPSPAPDYSKSAAWALIPSQPNQWSAADPPADVFFIHPTTFDGGRDWNGPIDNRAAARMLSEVMLPNYAGPFQRVGRVFAPRFRQASLYAMLANKEDAQESRRFAYGDVRRAFDAFLALSGGRPIIIVGVEQGGALGARLLDDVFAHDPQLSGRLVAAYLIDTIVPERRYRPGAPIPACTRPGETRCVLAWAEADDDADAAQLMKRALVWSPTGQLDNLQGDQPLCVNPMLGGASDAQAPVRLNLGATSATGLEWGARPAFSPRQVSAQCVGGFLRVSKPASPSLRRTGGWTDRLKAAPYNLFYADEEADAKARVAETVHAPGYVAPTPPGVINIVHSVVHQIR